MTSARNVCLILGLLSLACTLAGGVWALDPPEHANHTLLGREFPGDDLSLSIVAIGDSLGRREVIVWMSIENGGGDHHLLSPHMMEMKVDDGPWRECYYHKWSHTPHTSSCDDLETAHWSHGDYTLGPYSVVGFWAVWLLPEWQFESMKELSFEYPGEGIAATVRVSPGRIPEEIRYLVVEEPVRGETYAEFGPVRFRVYDIDLEPIEIEWWIEIDGEAILEGRDKQFEIDRAVCPILVETDPDVDLGDGPHQMVVHVSDGRLSSLVRVNFSTVSRKPLVPELSVEWAINISAVFPDSSYGSGHQGCQTVWDVDGDGEKEVVFGTRRGDSKRLWCFDSEADLEWIYPPLDGPGLPGDPTSKVSLVDVDDDGVFELCLAGRGGRLHVLNGDGNLVWYWDEPHRQDMWGAPQALDVDGDGFVEFFLTTIDGNVHRVSHDDRRVWTSFQTQYGNGGQPTICDIDQDGLYDVVWACQDHCVYCIDAGLGTEKWRFDTGSNMESNTVIVADLDGDGEFEALAWTSPPTSSVISINQTGSEEWVWSHPRQGTIRLCQAIGDLDKDGGMDMVIMSSDGGFALDISGDSPRILWEINFTRLSQEGYLPPGAVADYWSSYQLIADIDGDGELEVLWLAPYPIVTDAATGRVEAFYNNGHVAVGRRAENGAWWGDIDEDGVSEWIVELNGQSHRQTQIYCLTLGGSFPAESPWPEYYHTAYPAEYQWEQDWLTLKSAGSNSLWFPIQEAWIHVVLILLAATKRCARPANTCGQVG